MPWFAPPRPPAITFGAMTASTTAAGPLPLTGERTVPGIPHENYWFQRHVAAYAFAATRAVGKDVVDSGSGEGYGTAMLGEVARTAVGVELVGDIVDHAVAAYPGTDYLRADICDTGLPAEGTDLVVNLQVIEHLPDIPRFLAEQRRILRPGGELIVATPNRLTFTPHSHEPTNIFHVEEFTAEELTDRLVDVGGFSLTRKLGLHHGPRIAAAERATGRPFVDLVLEPVEEWPRWLAVLVARLTPRDFVWADTDLDDSLDLLAVCRR